MENIEIEKVGSTITVQKKMLKGFTGFSTSNNLFTC